MWKIHGKFYDLDEFLDNHPGGRVILESCKGKDDATAAFESYHAMSDMKKIKTIMKKYEVSDCDEEFNFKENGFYNILKSRVKSYFTNNNIDHHSNFYWIFKSIIQFALYIYSFIILCYYDLPFFYKLIIGFFSGHMCMQVGFGIMHDASHGAVSKNHKWNDFLSKTWSSLALWDDQLWRRHHCFRHHSFTGTTKDPDTLHFSPFIRKSENEKPSKYLNYTSNLFYLFILSIFPGMWLGQVLSYLRWFVRKHLWRITLEKYYFSFFETFLKLFTVFSLIYSRNFFVAYSFVVGINVTYFLCILPDHDTFETHSNLCDKEKDWGELQVRNSGNFSTNCWWVNDLFGGINYQIEHHLFPSICHVHFPKIKKIVKNTCLEFDIPYVEHETMYSAVKSSFVSFKNITKVKSS